MDEAMYVLCPLLILFVEFMSLFVNNQKLLQGNEKKVANHQLSPARFAAVFRDRVSGVCLLSWCADYPNVAPIDVTPTDG